MKLKIIFALLTTALVNLNSFKVINNSDKNLIILITEGGPRPVAANNKDLKEPVKLREDSIEINMKSKTWIDVEIKKCNFIYLGNKKVLVDGNNENTTIITKLYTKKDIATGKELEIDNSWGMILETKTKQNESVHEKYFPDSFKSEFIALLLDSKDSKDIEILKEFK